MKKALSLILALAMILALTACGSKTDAPSGDGDTQTDTPAEKIVLKIGHVEAEDRSTHKALLIFKDEIESKTDGRIEVQIFPNAELGGDEELCESVAMGTIQMALPSTSVLTAYNERIGVLDMPYLFTDAQSAFDALDGKLGEQIDEWIAGNGFISLGYVYNGPRCTTNSVRPIYTPDDLAGLKIRVMNSPVFIRMYEVLGANATPMSFSELFTGLQQHTVDGQENPIETIYNFQYYDVQNYLTVTNHLCTAGVVACNNDWYEGLSDEFKAAVDKAAEVAEAYSIEELNASEAGVLELLEDKMTVTELTDEQLSAFQEKAKTAWPQLREEIGADYFDQFLAAANLTLE